LQQQHSKYQTLNPSEHSSQENGARGDIFATTHWTVVLAAGRSSTPQSAHALEELCRAYWFPLYVYVRRRGHSKEDAEDLTQAFFTTLLEKNHLASLNSERGRFRAFLLASLKHFLANEWDKSQCQKRGGGIPHLSLDWQTADTKFQVAATNEPEPDQAFDREWAQTLLAKVIGRLENENKLDGRGKQFTQLKSFLTVGGNESSYREAAKNLNADETAVRVAVHRLRKRYRQLLREEISQTLSDPADLEEEMRALFNAFA
jgi:RNA polymerase sigma-70 factor (ECF subfamily)